MRIEIIGKALGNVDHYTVDRLANFLCIPSTSELSSESKDMKCFETLLSFMLAPKIGTIESELGLLIEYQSRIWPPVLDVIGLGEGVILSSKATPANAIVGLAKE